jgi:threonine dehydrogenase-like Zn-dependent dehydrogenase
MDSGTMMRNITLTGGLTPVRAYMDLLLREVLEGEITPGGVFDVELGIRDIATGYEKMSNRSALKVLVWL